jgi:hypothetical protein
MRALRTTFVGKTGHTLNNSPGAERGQTPEPEEAAIREEGDGVGATEDRSALGSILAGLSSLQSEYKDARLQKLIQKLQMSGDNLWEVETEEMEAMPKWLQEQNRAYVEKKENEIFLQKHRTSKAAAYNARRKSQVCNWRIGDVIEITKPGSHTGKKAVIVIPDWEGRILVKMQGPPGESADRGTKKSYMANEIKLIVEFKSKKRTSIVDSTHELMAGDGNWAFDVLRLAALLIQGKDAEGDNRSVVAGGVLSTVGVYLLTTHQVTRKFGVEEEAMLTFLRKIENLYVGNPYHNAIHGADCMRSIHYFLTASELGKHLTPLEHFAGLFAGAIHDVQVQACPSCALARPSCALARPSCALACYPPAHHHSPELTLVMVHISLTFLPPPPPPS